MSARFFNLNGEDYVMIKASAFQELSDSYDKLSLLEAYGVDNWEGYGEAMSEFYSDEEED